MKRCCGIDRDSLFCPDCGKELMANDTVRSLIHHIQLRIIGLRARKRLRYSGKDLTDCHRRHLKTLESHIEQVESWIEWVNARNHRAEAKQ